MWLFLKILSASAMSRNCGSSFKINEHIDNLYVNVNKKINVHIDNLFVNINKKITMSVAWRLKIVMGANNEWGGGFRVCCFKCFDVVYCLQHPLPDVPQVLQEMEFIWEP